MRTVFYPQVMKLISALVISAVLSTSSFAQMWNGQDSLYGNEWITTGQDYYKIEVSENGLYRIPRSVLASAGFSVDSEPSLAFQLFAYGQEVPMYASTAGVLGANDYLEFYGEKHTVQMDQYLFTKISDMLNPDYSVITDKSIYYLTLSPGNSGLRYQNVANDLNNPGAPQGSYMHEEAVIFSEQHVKLSFGQGVKYSHFDQSEGFASNYSKTRSISLKTSDIVTAVGNSKLKVRFNTSSNTHDLEVSLNGNNLLTESFSGFQLRNHEFDLTTNSLTADNTLAVNGAFDNNDRYSVAYGKLIYPRAFNFNDQEIFNFDLASGNRQYLEITNFNEAGGQPVVYDLTNQTRIAATYESGGDIVRVVLPAGMADRKVVLSNNQGGVTIVENLKKFTPVDFENKSGDYIIVSHPALMGQGGGVNYVNEYAQYRASAAGGGFDVEIVNIEDIENQFGYGSPKHPQSMRNFAHWLDKNWNSPKYIFIIGKGLEYTEVRTETELNDPQNSAFYIPTWGSPGSDNLLVSDDLSSLPVIPTGRMPASTPDQIKRYLDKVKLQEQSFTNPQTIDDKYWMRRILHLSGGGTGESAQIASALGGMENLISNNGFGADVSTFYKTSTDPVQISESEGIFNLINDGVSIITFFGHSSAGTFDFNIDNPDNYENYGKYPLIMSLGCYSGNIHTSAVGISERFTFYEDKGASAFIASTGQGYVSPLASFGNFMYQNLGEDQYNMGIGDVLKATLDNLNVNTSFSVRTLVQQLTLNGDPALKYYNVHPGPDYLVDGSTVKFNPEVLNAQLDSFEISFDVVNLGRGFNDSMELAIEQLLPSGEQYALKMNRIAAPFGRSAFSFKLPNFGSIAAGLNRFIIRVDDKEEIEELPSPTAEMNNSVIGPDNQEGIPIFIFDNSLEPIFPADFAMVNNEQPVRLVCSTRDALTPEQTWLIEIDTTESFTSPMKVTHATVNKGGVIEWEPNMSWENERVYYWRASPDSTSTESSYIWQSRSFVYLENGDPGWNQSHFYQYKRNEYDGLEVQPGENLEYLANGYFIRVVNKVDEPNDRPYFSYNFNPPSGSVAPWNFLDAGIAFQVSNGTTGVGWANPPGGNYGTVNPNYNTYVFAFKTGTPAERQLVYDFLNNVVQPNDFVFAWTVQNNFNADYKPELWAQDEVDLGESIFSIFENEGAQSVRDLENLGAVPYIYYYQKGEGTIGEKIASNINETITLDEFIPVPRSSGIVSTDQIGPAQSWNSLSWQKDKDDNDQDSTSVYVYGIAPDGEESLLFENIQNSELNLQKVSAQSFPYLRLELHSEDENLRTATNLINWRISYTGLPDLALNPNFHYELPKNNFAEGESFTFEIGVTNTSNQSIEQSDFSTKLIFADQTVTFTDTISNLNPGESTIVAVPLETINRAGTNRLILEANPQDAPKEQYRFNNLATLTYDVEQDKSNPLLEVVFDGVPIMNGDIVSAKPNVSIRLKDENPYLSLTDTTLMKIILKTPNDEVRGIYFSDPSINFTPATDQKNEAYLEWQPHFETDGTYQLIVQGEDVTGNQSGKLDYKVNFEIVNEKMISNVLNYPNPFSTSTRFVYTLTGDQSPDYFKIQIFTVSGRIVKEITQDEIGPLKVGTHRTDYAWDGTDDFGDRLANGIYLYRVVTNKAGGEAYKSMINNSVDSFFTEGFGKMVIMR